MEIFVAIGRFWNWLCGTLCSHEGDPLLTCLSGEIAYSKYIMVGRWFQMKARDTRCGYITSESSTVCCQCKTNNRTRLCFE